MRKHCKRNVFMVKYSVDTDVLVCGCRALNCDIGAIAEIVLQESKVE